MGKVQSNKTQVNFHMGEGKTSPVGITNLIVESYYLQGARSAIRTLWESGLLQLEGSSCTKHERRVYGQAIYDLIMHDNTALYSFLCDSANCRIAYYDWVKDKKGKLVSCKAKLM